MKLDNALLDGKEPATVKLCDFGFAKQWGRDRKMFTDIGSDRALAETVVLQIWQRFLVEPLKNEIQPDCAQMLD